MTVQFPQIDSAKPRLSPDSYAQRTSDRSFEEKLRLEQARLGLFFSPLSQLEGLFSYPFSGEFKSADQASQKNIYSLLEEIKPPATGQQNQSHTSSPTPHTPSPQTFDSLPAQASGQNFLQQILARTGWLTPNLEAKPSFFQAFLEGKLQLKLDLQALIDQIVEKVKLVKSKGQAELSLTLKPEDLGEIILLITSRSGIVSIQIQASPETKKLIDSQRAELERALKKANVNFDQIQVKEVEKYA